MSAVCVCAAVANIAELVQNTGTPMMQNTELIQM